MNYFFDLVSRTLLRTFGEPFYSSFQSNAYPLCLRTLSKFSRLNANKDFFLSQLSKYLAAPPDIYLVSQPQRSGGTLAFQLFDSHPHLNVFPYELNIFNPNKWLFPSSAWISNLSDAQALNHFLYNDKLLLSYIIRGMYAEYRGGENKYLDFNINIAYIAIALKEWHKSSDRSLYMLLLYYLVGFNSGLKSSNLVQTQHSLPFLFFIPSAILEQSTVDHLIAEPKLKLLSFIRDPIRWYSSAKKHDSSLYTLDYSLSVYSRFFQSLTCLSENSPHSYHLESFEDLVVNTPLTMKNLCSFMNIPFSDIVITPTLFGTSVPGNSSFSGFTSGVDSRSVTRNINNITDSEYQFLNDELMPIYEKILSL